MTWLTQFLRAESGHWAHTAQHVPEDVAAFYIGGALLMLRLLQIIEERYGLPECIPCESCNCCDDCRGICADEV